MIPLVAIILFLMLLGSFTFLGTKLWSKPQSALDRVAAFTAEAAARPQSPALAWRDLVRKFGALLPSNPKAHGKTERQLIRAGFRKPAAVKILYGFNILSALILGVLAGVCGWAFDAESNSMLMSVISGIIAGFIFPSEFVRWKMRKRQKSIRKALPNALDLMVVCVESGLGLDQTIVQVGKELRFAHPEIAGEFYLMNLEIKAGKRRAEALRNMAARNSVPELKKLVAVLIQADRFGTSIAQTLRGHSEYLRVESRQNAEEKAAKLGVKLIFPIFFFIMPTLFIVTLAPVVVKIFRELLPMMDNM
ncbi:MAG: type II secretion system F family protein [Acidobacteriota bacterium]|nr:type II secretion system F family protein [Acidobacteriota bacterium]